MPKWRQLTRGSLVLGLVRTHKAVHLLWLANYPSGTCAGRHLLQVTGGGFSSSSSMDTSQSSAATAPSSGMPSVPWGFYTVGSLSLEHVGSVLVYGIDTCQECGA